MDSCPVTGKTAAATAATSSAEEPARCPVTGQTGASQDPSAATATAPQCPVTGQFADGSRPAPVLTAEQQSTPIRYTLIGTPFSTFTRTLAMGLHELGLPFTQVTEATPHSNLVPRMYSPFGKIPVLLMQHGERTLGMAETASIARYLDAGAHGLLRFAETDRIKNQRLEEMVSLISDAVFGFIERDVVKVFLKDRQVEAVGDEALAQLQMTLTVIQDRLHGPYIFGMATTWADLFLFPILADLQATPFSTELAKFDKLKRWLDRMSKRDSAIKTREGTLEAGASPPA